MHALMNRAHALRGQLFQAWPTIHGAWLASLIVILAIAVLDFANLWPSIKFAGGALVSTAPYIIFAVLLIAYMKATGAEVLVAKAFEGQETRMIVAAALFGGLAPFCSCEVIPFIAGLLAMGAPLSAVMAFWLSSPLIDPPSLLITASALGWEFAIGKAIAAVAVGLFGGFVMKAALAGGLFTDPLRNRPATKCCGSAKPKTNQPVWRFWHEPERRANFGAQFIENGHFLLKWLTLAYLLESVMISYIPASAIASVVGGDGLLPIIVSAVVGVPAYLNSYAAPALVDGLIDQGMSVGAGMAFMVAGAVSSIPAMTAVFALVKPRVFAAYASLGLLSAILSGVLFGAVYATFLVS